MPPASSAFLRIVDGLLRAGEVRKARAALEKVLCARVPREQRAALSALARRAQIPELSLRLLGTVVRGQRRGTAAATPRECAEYADALTRTGATEEAIFRLRRLSPTEVPEAAAFLASALFAQWDFQAAVDPLERFLAVTEDEYERTVARLNLAVTRIDGRLHDEAESLLSSVRTRAQQRKWTRIYGNSLEASAGNAVWAGRWKEAEAFLAMAERALGPRARKDALVVEKWRVLLALRRDGATAGTRLGLERVRRSARKLGFAETVRDCDRHEAIVSGDVRLGARVFFGTPYAAFRRRLREDLGAGVVLPEHFDWEPEGAAGGGRIFTIAQGRLGEKGHLWAEGAVSARLLAAIVADFYRPAPPGVLFTRAFPDQFYHPESAVARVHQSLLRLRADLRRGRVPLSVEENEGAYRLCGKGAILVRLGAVARDRKEALLQSLRRHFPASLFSAQQAVEVCGAHRRGVQRALQRAVDEGIVERVGFATASRYRFR